MIIDQSLGFRIERVNVDIIMVANDCVTRKVWVPQIPVVPKPEPDDKIVDEFDLCELTRAVMFDKNDEVPGEHEVSKISLVREPSVLEVKDLDWSIKLK